MSVPPFGGFPPMDKKKTQRRISDAAHKCDDEKRLREAAKVFGVEVAYKEQELVISEDKKMLREMEKKILNTYNMLGIIGDRETMSFLIELLPHRFMVYSVIQYSSGEKIGYFLTREIAEKFSGDIVSKRVDIVEMKAIIKTASRRAMFNEPEEIAREEEYKAEIAEIFGEE